MLLAFAGLFITSHTHGDGSGAVSNTPAPATYFDPSLYTPEQLSFSTIDDGIPDVWKDYYGFSLADPELAQADYNSSGVTNLVKYLANLWPLDAPDPQPLVPTAPVKKAASTQSKAEAAPASEFSFDGSFSIPSSITLKNGSGGYKNGAFKWNYVDGLVGKWQAYVGSKVEAWKVNDPEVKDGLALELDATGWNNNTKTGDYGIKQELKNITPGTYLLSWKELGRSSGDVEGNHYEVWVGYGAEKVADYISPAPLDTKKWVPRGLAFSITQDQIDAAKNNGGLWLNFIPKGKLNSYGTLICNVGITPIEIMQPKDGAIQGVLKVTNEIRLCRWLDNDTAHGGETIKLQPFPEKDADRIVVRIKAPGKEGSSNLTIKVSTEGGDAAHNHSPTEIDLKETSTNSGVFESLPFVAVADRDDDDAVTGTPGGANRQKNDRTHISQSGGKLIVECAALGITRIEKPIRKNTHFFEVTSVVLDVPGDDLEVIPAQFKVRGQANWLSQAYLPYGIEARHTDGGVITVDSTTKTDLYQILTRKDSTSKPIPLDSTNLSPDLAKILADPNVSSLKTEKNIVIVYVNSELGGPNTVGVAQTGALAGYIIVSLKTLIKAEAKTPGLKAYNAAHECGHALGLYHKYIPTSGSAVTDPPRYNLMRDGSDRWGRDPLDAGKSGRRLLREQFSSIKRSPFLQPIQ